MNIAMILGLFPAFMSMVAVYYILKSIGLSEGAMIRVALVLVYSGSSGLGFYIAKGFFDTIPKALDEAAYIDEFHLLLKEEQTAAYSVEIWKRFRKWGGIPTGITQNVKDMLRSPEIANILENSDFIYMLNQASDDRNILAQRLNISPHQLSYVTNSGEGEGLLFYGNVILPFVDRFPTDLELYRIMTTKLSEVQDEKEV